VRVRTQTGLPVGRQASSSDDFLFLPPITCRVFEILKLIIFIIILLIVWITACYEYASLELSK